MRLQHRIALSFALVCGLAMLPGCNSRSAADEDSEGQKTPSHLVAEGREGPAVVQVFLDREEARFGDRIRLMLTAQVEQGAVLQDPVFDDRLGHLRVRDRVDPALDGEARERTQTWMFEVEAERAGLNIGKIPDIPFVITKVASPSAKSETEGAETPGEGNETRFVKVPSFKLEVAGLSEEARPNLSVAEAALPPLPVPPPDRFALTMWVAAGGALLLLALGLGRWWYTREREEAPPPPIDPKAEARSAFDALMRAGHLEAKRFGEFYVGLTGIVRQYIERTEGIAAPDLTTEEFLRQIEQNKGYAIERRVGLKRFLEASDLVKYAAQVPGGTETDNAIDAALNFCGLRDMQSSTAGASS